MVEELKKELNCVQGCKGVDVPTDQEVGVLQAMRRIKFRVKEIKKTLMDMDSMKINGTGEKRIGLESELIELKKKWESLEKEREAAAEERMKILGHLEP